ncbi:hypothetical protein C7212DRAFT_366214 [Tuber magnatum]|uniref:Hydrophobin n=1 Tax=Tuber magnatum TaxID=42249 RepID=A0A317SFY6_9PEZI|nr:hypothetical protein C7212DRAFT_366214 [Tuber magnatum]
MVSIKPLVVLLFTAAVAAIPVVGDEHHDVGRNGNINGSNMKCENPEQTLFCCNDSKSSEVTGTFSGILDNSFVKCDALAVNGWDGGLHFSSVYLLMPLLGGIGAKLKLLAATARVIRPVISILLLIVLLSPVPTERDTRLRMSGGWAWRT